MALYKFCIIIIKRNYLQHAYLTSQHIHISHSDAAQTSL